MRLVFPRRASLQRQSARKVFGIGLPKTGTMSLYRGLSILGFDAVHYPIKTTIPAIQRGRYSAFDDHEAFANCGEWHFAALEREYPQAKFIWTHRPLEQWLSSVRKHFEFYRPARRNTRQYENRLEVFATTVFDPDVMATIYTAHSHAVEMHFAGRGNLLVLDVTESNAWRKLCEFVEVSAPDQEFPHENKANGAAG